MGGYAYVIPGRLSVERARTQESAPARPVSFWSRLFGSRDARQSSPHVVHLPNGDRLHDIPADTLAAALVRDFRAWVGARIPSPSEGTVAKAYEGDPRLTGLDDVFTPFMREPRCRCQMCDPAFGDAKRA